MGIVTRGIKARTISHICYGEFERIYPALLDLPVRQLDLEAANGGFALLDLLSQHPWPEDKELALGVVDVHSHRIESVDEVKAGIRKALEVVPAANLYIDPDCGLKTRTWEEAQQKLAVMVRAAEEVRSEEGLS
jgi:5-methyltetrahydropteroyltriglutamate--homocysteine methyltransferase